MMEKMNRKLRNAAWLGGAGFSIVLLLGVAVQGQIAEAETAARPPVVTQEPVVVTPLFTSYKSITIGTPADEVRDKLGKAEIDDKDGFYYRFSDDEFAQIRVDKDGKVRLLSITYSAENAPTFADVFGPTTAVVSRADGSIYKLVRYPEAGYWVAYSRTAGERPTTTVTLQKIRTAK